MPSVFISKPGTVAVVNSEDQALPGRIDFPELNNYNGIITDATYGQKTNQQFQSSLQDTIYMYVFGDQMGQLNIKGLLFVLNCSTGGVSGIEAVMTIYGQNKASTRSTPVMVHIGSKTVSGYLTELEVSAVDPANRINRFIMTISSLPEKI